MKKRIVVTKKDIELGMPFRNTFGGGQSCPIARAVLRAFNKKPGFVAVGCAGMELNYGTNKSKDVLLPDSAQKFINKFENCDEVKPFQFTVEI